MGYKDQEGMKHPFHMWTADCCGNPKNCRYPGEYLVTSAKEFEKVAAKDHTGICFRNHYRSEDNFLYADCVVVDCDNSHSDRPEDWITERHIREALPDVEAVIYRSRSDGKTKGRQSARPRFHVVFPAGRMTKPEELKALLQRIQEYLPFFDARAMDAARFFFGNPGTEVTVLGGSKTIDAFFAGEDAFSHMGEEIEEGSRNATMFRWAVRYMKRYGDTEEARKQFYMEAERCSPPLPEEELGSIWRSAGKYYKKIRSQPGYVSPGEYNGTQPVGWEEPIPFGRFHVMPFPVEALPPAIGNYVRAVAKSTQTPVDMAGSVAISMMSTCLQGKFQIRGKADWTEPLNTYVLAIAPPSERKSAVLHAMVRPVNIYEVEYNRRNSGVVEGSRMQKRILEKRQRAIEDQVAKGKADMSEVQKIADEIASFTEIRPLKLYVDDITTEKLVSVLSENRGRAALISSEGGIFDTLAGIYTKNVNIDVMLKGYSGDPIRVDRIGRESECIMNPTLTVLLMAQPNIISEVIGNPTFRGRGLTARFLYCMPESSVGERDYDSDTVSDDIYREYERCVFNLLEDDNGEIAETITLSHDADRLLAAFANEIEPKLIREYAEIGDWAGKLVGNVLRISGLLCRAGIYRSHDFLDVSIPLVVDGATMKNAIAIGRYYLNHAQAAFSVLPENEMFKKAGRILQMIREEGYTSFDRRMAMRKCRGFKTVAEIQPVLDFLEDYGYIRQKNMENFQLSGRRPLPKYEVNPLADHLVVSH